jgi:hypothetical protein
MFQEVSYSIAESADACGPDQFSLRPHDWIRWERLTISPIAAVLLATATVAPVDEQNSTGQLNALRDELCDLMDALSSIGLQIPLTLVVSCEESTYAAWHRLAGDQNWIRGSFFIEPFSNEAFEGVAIDGGRDYAALLTDVEGTHASKYRLVRLTNEHYLGLVRGRLETEEPSARSLAEYVLDAFESDSTVNANEPVGQRTVQDALRRWLEQEVVSKAMASTAGPQDDSDVSEDNE